VEKEPIILVYDKQCPACDHYCKVIRIRETVGELKIINARDASLVVDEITALGMDMDQGMVLKMGGVFYYGSDAIHALALISSRSGVLNKINYWVFKSSHLSKVLYPVMRFLRNTLLKILGKTKINNLQIKGNHKF